VEVMENEKWIVKITGNGWNMWDILICPNCKTEFENVRSSKYHYCPYCGKRLQYENPLKAGVEDGN
jgi:rRNA maturation endonuclease Nob1